MFKAFISYSHIDERILERLHVHMAVLKRDGKIASWYDKEILAGGDLNTDISSALSDSDIFLAIVSPDYLNSQYCYEKEFQEALKMQERGQIIIVPIIAEPCDWKSSPFGSMKAVPKDGKPVSEWTNENVAYLNIVDELRRLMNAKQFPRKAFGTTNVPIQIPTKNYKVKRDFTEVDRLNFKEDSFETIRNYFKESLEEINGVEQIQARFVDNDKKSFTCIISNRAKADSKGFITVLSSANDAFGRSDLSYSLAERRSSNVIQLDKLYTVEQNDYELFWSFRSMYSSQTHEVLTANQIAEKLWLEFIEQVGISY
jgi:hypothetical protein